MEDRNKLFKKVHGLLVREGASHDEARKLVKEELRGGKRHRAPGGQDGRTPDVILIDDLCEGINLFIFEKYFLLYINKNSFCVRI